MQPRFRPTLTEVEQRLTPASPADVVNAVVRTDTFAHILTEAARHPERVYLSGNQATALPVLAQIAASGDADAQQLGEVRQALTQAVADVPSRAPSFNPYIRNLASHEQQARTNAAVARQMTAAVNALNAELARQQQALRTYVEQAVQQRQQQLTGGATSGGSGNGGAATTGGTTGGTGTTGSTGGTTFIPGGTGTTGGTTIIPGSTGGTTTFPVTTGTGTTGTGTTGTTGTGTTGTGPSGATGIVDTTGGTGTGSTAATGAGGTSLTP